LGIEIVGISGDLAPSQQVFKETTGAQNHFLSDPELEVTARYGAVNDGGAVRTARRYYYLIDEEGILAWKNVTGGLIPVEALLDEMTEFLSGD
jgi:peroxiredoxin